MAALLLGGCTGSGRGGSDGRLAVTATTTQVADLVRNVGGDRVDVAQILRPNADPHAYEPRPGDALALRRAKVVFSSGGDVDEWLAPLVEQAGSHTPIVKLIDAVDSLPGPGPGGDGVDPHWWQDPRNAEAAVSVIRDKLVAADADGRDFYEQRASAYLRKLARLDASIAACIGRVPAAERKLVTSHDALGYYTRRYGIELVGAAIPSRSTQAQPSAASIMRLVELIEREHVHAVFPEASVSPKLERAIARETGAKLGRELWSDALGPKGSSGATYIGSLITNTEALVDGLSGGRVSCRPAA